MKCMNAVGLVVAHVVSGGARKATKYLSPTLVISACRHGKPGSDRGRDQVVVKIGDPNVRQVAFIKDCKKAGVSFPVRKVQIQHYPKRGK